MKRELIVAATATMSLLACANNPYISKVYEYVPAPGQFINTMPEWNDGQDHGDMAAAAQTQLAGDAMPGMICLGAFGGYVIFGFDHPVVNVAGEYDLKIYGNAFRSDKELNGGSCEPGVVWVSRDDNGNGLPDDRWYQLAGSEYYNPATIHNFTIRYHKPAADHEAVPDPDNRLITDMEYIRWTSDNPLRPEGYIQANSFHRQSYWPEWHEGEILELTGTLLPDNAVDTSGKGTSWVTCAYGEGYVDNMPNNEDPGLKLEWAVDENGDKVWLPAVDFIKVQSAMLQNTGWLGESSTEVCGAEDLHPEALPEAAESPYINADTHNAAAWVENGMIWVKADAGMRLNIYTTTGSVIHSAITAGGIEQVGALPRGLYIIEIGSYRKKLY